MYIGYKNLTRGAGIYPRMWRIASSFSELCRPCHISQFGPTLFSIYCSICIKTTNGYVLNVKNAAFAEKLQGSSLLWNTLISFFILINRPGSFLLIYDRASHKIFSPSRNMPFLILSHVNGYFSNLLQTVKTQMKCR